jgi:hypothetical protein
MRKGPAISGIGPGFAEGKIMFEVNTRLEIGFEFRMASSERRRSCQELEEVGGG